MGISNSNKEFDKQTIQCGDTFKIKLSLGAEPDIVTNPTDIVLILDRSASMNGKALTNLKGGAKKFVEIIDQATDGDQDGQIGNGSHIGIVSFSTTATQNTQLITSVQELDDAIDALNAGGSTNQADAFTQALDLFDPTSQNAKVMVMFTDGVRTAGADPTPVATTAKNQGVIIYVIGLSGNGGIDEQALKDWSSDPDSVYVAITPDDAELEKIFEDLAKNITKPGATDIVVTDKVIPCFKIIALSSPSKGTATLLDNQSVEWKIDELGRERSEGATFEFTAQHVGTCTGDIKVNESITYHDHEGNVVTFPEPTIDVNCNIIVIPENCPQPFDFEMGSCQDTIEFDAGFVDLESLGRIIQIDVTLRNICPNKRVALAVILTEVDPFGVEHRRGLKVITVPEHFTPFCQDVTVRCIKFVVPEDLDNFGIPNSLCNNRRFRVRFIANYIDNGFDCCQTIV